MKTKQSIFLVILLISIFSLKSQTSIFPSVDIFTLNGDRIDASIISNDSMPMVVVFFKSFNKECTKNLLSLNEANDEFISHKGIKVIAICIDCIGNMDHLKPYISGHNINLQVFIDKNGDLKRKMGIQHAPYTLIYDHNKNIFCKYSGYCTGIQDMICMKLKECLSKINVE